MGDSRADFGRAARATHQWSGPAACARACTRAHLASWQRGDPQAGRVASARGDRVASVPGDRARSRWLGAAQHLPPVGLGRLTGSADVSAWGQRAADGVLRSVSTDGLALDWDVRANVPIEVKTCAGLSPLLLPGLSAEQFRGLCQLALGPQFAGAEGL